MRRCAWTAALLAALVHVVASSMSPARVAAQSDSNASQCGWVPDDSPRLEWDYTPSETGDARIVCVAEDIARVVETTSGSWGLAIRDFSTGETLLLNPDKAFIAGSLYKLGVAAEAYASIEAGSLTEQSLVGIGTQEVDPEYGGSMFAAGTYLTVRQAVVASITRSDNGASLALVNRLGLNALNGRFKELGMPGTRLVYEAETTPRDLLTYFTLLADGELISPDVSDTLLGLLADQQINYLIPAGLPPGEDWWIAHKTGNVDAMLGDAGILFTPNGACALVIINNELTSYEASIHAFQAISRSLFRAMVPLQDARRARAA